MAVIDDTLLSAYLDGELASSYRLAIPGILAEDRDLAGQFVALKAADALIHQILNTEIDEAVPDHLVDTILSYGAPPVANKTYARSPAIKWPIAASLAALIVGAAGGLLLQKGSAPSAVVASRVWVDDIVEYHRAYATQPRHLVEVGPKEVNHIERWFTNTVGAPVVVADLSDFGLEFLGARLLVAAGKPVAQLVYTDADNAITTLCIIQDPSPRETVGVEQRGEFRMVLWGGENANLMIIGDARARNLETIARTLDVDT